MIFSEILEILLKILTKKRITHFGTLLSSTKLTKLHKTLFRVVSQVS